MTVELNRIAPWALIAGGSEGVGACFARRLASQGINLALVARKPEPLEALAAELRAEGVEVRTLRADLTAPDALEQVRAITDDLEIGLMIHNAGSICEFGDFVDSPLERAEGTIKINVLSQVHFAHHFGGAMRHRGKGAIVLMGSMAGNAGCAKTAAYAQCGSHNDLNALSDVEGWWRLVGFAANLEAAHLSFDAALVASMSPWREALLKDLAQNGAMQRGPVLRGERRRQR